MSSDKMRPDLLEMKDEYKKAEFALQVRRYDLAIEIMQKALNVFPEDSHAFFIIARAYTLKSNNHAALQAIRNSLRLNPASGAKYALYGCLLADASIYDQAEKALATALEIDPSSASAHYGYATLLLKQKKDFERAKEHARKAIELDPENALYHLKLGKILGDEGQLDQADLAYRHALRLEPDDPAILNDYGAYLQNKRKKLHAASEYYRQAVMRDPNNDTIRHNFLIVVRAFRVGGLVLIGLGVLMEVGGIVSYTHPHSSESILAPIFFLGGFLLTVLGIRALIRLANKPGVTGAFFWIGMGIMMTVSGIASFSNPSLAEYIDVIFAPLLIFIGIVAAIGNHKMAVKLAIVNTISKGIIITGGIMVILSLLILFIYLFSKGYIDQLFYVFLIANVIFPLLLGMSMALTAKCGKLN